MRDLLAEGRKRAVAGVAGLALAALHHEVCQGAGLRWAARALCLLALGSPLVQAGETTRVSVDSAGVEADADSFSSSISANGRFVAFASDATNLVPGDTNGHQDVFVHDRKTGTTTRVSVNSAGDEANAQSLAPSISATGRFVAFFSLATNLVPDDMNGQYDVFVHDRKTGTTTRVSVNSAGDEANAQSFAPSISATGRFVAFYSVASNLVPGDDNGDYDVFVHDRKLRKTTRVSVSSAGDEGNNESSTPSISGTGRFVAFASFATNLVPGDDNDEYDVFVHDRKTGQTTRMSVNSAGDGADGESYTPSISARGRFVAFESDATNLVPGDGNDGYDVFVHDRKQRTTTRVSVNSAGDEGESDSYTPSISANGRFVAFVSVAANFVPGDSNNAFDAFVHDRKQGTLTRVSVDSSGSEGNGSSFSPSLSATGRFVAFYSSASNLVPADLNGEPDVFLHDRK